MSKLIVKVEKISKIEKHPNADKLSIVSMEGNDWHCIVGLNEYKVGDLVIYCPIDSIIPADLIEKYNLEYLKKNGRVRTVKLRKYISQGLILAIPEGKRWKVGGEVGKELNITKYEPPVPKYQQLKGNMPTKRKRNPHFDKYTDIENIKNFNQVFKEGDEVVILEKIHGSSFRASNLPIHLGYSFLDKIKYLIQKYIFKKEYEFVYGSHNVQITSYANRKCFYDEDVYGRIAKKYNLAEIIPNDYIVYAEVFGAKIQGAGYNYGLLNDIDAVFFDVKYKGQYLDYYAFTEFCLQRNLPTVPELYRGNFDEQILKEQTVGQSVLYPPLKREGCVIKTIKEENNPRIGRKILKSINVDYLLIKGITDSK